jgi:hypothetical protein
MSSFLSILAIISTGTGIFFLWLLLRRFFSVPVSLVTTIIVVFGTNYFRWNFFDGATPHNFLFTLFAIFVWLTLKWSEDQKWVWLILMIPVMIISCFLHQLSMLLVLFPLLCGLHDPDSWRALVTRIRNHPFQYLFFLAIIVTVFVLTRFNWFSGPGTKFYFGEPKAAVYPFLAANLNLILFSFKKGWFIYTPIILLIFPGFYFLAEKARHLFFSVFLFFILWLLLASSHKMWASDPGFGQRFFIEIYPVLALPLGFFVDRVWGKRPVPRMIFLMFPAFCILLNLFQSWQYDAKIISPKRMNREIYFSVFGRTHISSHTLNLMEIESGEYVETIPPEGIYRITRIEDVGFEPTETKEDRTPYDLEKKHSGKASLVLTKENRWYLGYNRKISGFPGKNPGWLRVTSWIFYESSSDKNNLRLHIYCEHNNQTYKWSDSPAPFVSGKWSKIVVDYQVPLEFPDPKDKIEVRFFYQGDAHCYIDDFTIDFFEPVNK